MRLVPRPGVHRSVPDADSLLPPLLVRVVLALAGVAGLISVVMAARA